MNSRKLWNRFFITLLVVGDAIGLLLALRLTTFGQTGLLHTPWILLFAGGVALTLVFSGGYRPEGSGSRVDEAVIVAKSIFMLTVVMILIDAVVQVSLPVGPREWVYLAVIFGVFSVTYRWVLRSIQKYLFRFDIGTQRTLIVGANRRSAALYRQIMAQPKLGYKLVGFVEDKPGQVDDSFKPVVGDLKALPGLIRDLDIDEVVVALEKPEHEALLKLLSEINGEPIEIKILPDMYEAVTGLAKTEDVYGLPLVRINPVFITPLQSFIKRGIDLLVSLIGLVTAAPLMAVIAVMVRLTSPGPAIFTQERMGYRGKRFTIHKFRTMVEGAEKRTGPVWAKADDPRITPLGRILRRARLDELPQLWNVLMGEMSLVGPRPERSAIVEWLMEEFPYYYRRLLVRPGLTGWAQVRGNYDTSIEDVRRKLKDDFFYVENFSIRLDLKILLMTVWVVLRGKGH